MDGQCAGNPNGPFCNVGPDVCVACLDDTDCADGDFCNGAEVCAPNGTCQPGGDPCTDPALSVCDEADDECVECLIDDDCTDNPNGPICSIGPDICVECLADEDCDDASACTGDTCSANACINADTTPVGECCDPDTGTLTTIDDGDECTDDICNEDGTVNHLENFLPSECCDSSTGATTPIDDGNGCSTDTCNEDGSVSHELLAAAPFVEGIGARVIIVTPDLPDSSLAVALLLTSPNFPCLAKYIDEKGHLGDTPVSRTPAEWGSLLVVGGDIVPSTNTTDTVYHVQADCGETLTDPGIGITSLWGDVDNNGVVDLDDVTLILNAFAGQFSLPFEVFDVFPCEPNGAIDFDDILMILYAFEGDPFPCATPCGGGACCLDPEPLCLILLEQECSDLGGTFQGAGTVCVPNICQ